MKRKTVFLLAVFILVGVSGCKPAPVSLAGLATFGSMGVDTEIIKDDKIPYYTPLIELLSETGHFKSISDISLGANGKPSTAPVFYMITASSEASLDDSEITLIFCCKFDDHYQRIVEFSGRIIIRSNGQERIIKLNMQKAITAIYALYVDRDKKLKDIIDYYLQQFPSSQKTD